MSSSPVPSDEEVQDYLHRHHIDTLFSNMRAALVKNLPEKPLEFLEDYIRTEIEELARIIDRQSSTKSRRRNAPILEASIKPSSEPTRVIPKSNEQKDQIRAALKNLMMFTLLDKTQLEVVIDAMEHRIAPKGTVIIREGEQGDTFYLIAKGDCECFKAIPNTPFPGLSVAQRTAGESFGELALIYGTPRAATVVSKTDCELWEVDRTTFRQANLNVAFAKRNSYEAFLKKVPILSSLLPYEHSCIADVLEEKSYEAGATIIQQGDILDSNFYLLMEGTAHVLKQLPGDEHPTEVHSYSPGDYFGELALLERAPRAATVVAATPCTVVFVDRESFTRLLGPLSEILKRKGKQYADDDKAAKARGSPKYGSPVKGGPGSPVAAVGPLPNPESISGSVLASQFDAAIASSAAVAPIAVEQQATSQGVTSSLAVPSQE